MRTFTKEELKKYDGSEGLMYFAYGRQVYDVSASFLWKKGKHQATHYAGCDLTQSLEEAPHGPELLDRYPIVGELRDEE